VVKLGDLHSRNRAGKAVLKVPEGSGVIAPVPMPAVEGALLAAVNSDGRLLAFPAADLPELPRGKGNKIFGIPSKKAATGEEYLVAIAVVAPGQTLRVLSGERHMGLTFKELGEYRGERGQRGAVLPRGWRKVDGVEVE
jgi:topoisomerase-4 subunit A